MFMICVNNCQAQGHCSVGRGPQIKFCLGPLKALGRLWEREAMMSPCVCVCVCVRTLRCLFPPLGGSVVSVWGGWTGTNLLLVSCSADRSPELTHTNTQTHTHTHTHTQWCHALWKLASLSGVLFRCVVPSYLEPQQPLNRSMKATEEEEEERSCVEVSVNAAPSCRHGHSQTDRWS